MKSELCLLMIVIVLVGGYTLTQVLRWASTALAGVMP